MHNVFKIKIMEISILNKVIVIMIFFIIEQPYVQLTIRA